MNRSKELERLTREVEAKFRALPNCPKGLVVELELIGNIRVAYGERHHVFNPLFVDAAMHRDGWAAAVLAQLLGPAAHRIAEVARRANVVAGLRAAQVAFLQEVERSGMIFLLDASKIAVAVDLEQKGLLVHAHHTEAFYALTEFGREALGAFNV